MKRQAAWMGSLTVFALLSCSDNLSTQTVTFKVTEIGTGTDMKGTTALASIELTSGQVGTAKEADGVTSSGTSDSDGSVSFQLTDGYTYSISGAGNTDRLGNVAFVTVNGALNLSNFPLVMPPRVFRSNNFCVDMLRITGTGDDGTAHAWVRVIKTSGTLSDSDTLTIKYSSDSTGAGSDVDSGSDLVDNVVSNGSLNYLDIYKDANDPGDALGHKDAIVFADTDENQTTKMTVTLNGTSLTGAVTSCSKGGMQTFYF